MIPLWPGPAGACGLALKVQTNSFTQHRDTVRHDDAAYVTLEANYAGL